MIHGTKLKESQKRYDKKEEEKKYRWKIHDIKVKKREKDNGYNQSLTVHLTSPG
jgi:hypothetical protein